MPFHPAFRRRILSLWFPRLSTDRIRRRETLTQSESGSGETPLALAIKSAGAERVAAVDALADAHGLHAGMTVAEARAICPGLRVLPHDPAADARLLDHIADWADRYTPMVGRDPPQGLFLDITGAAHLMGGEVALARDCLARLARQGFTAAAAIAPTAGAAWALVRAKGRGHIPETASPEALETALAPLSVASLRLPPETVAALRRLGLKTIGDLIARPREPLTARFGPSVILRLDQARGRIDEPITPQQPVPPAAVSETLVEPILTTGAVETAMRLLAARLSHILEDRGQGATAVELAVFRVDGRVVRIAIRLAEPSRDAKLIADLLALRLDHLDDPLDPGFGFDALRLAATSVAATVAAEGQFTALGGISSAESVSRHARLVDRLSARFGSDRVLHLTTASTHIPEAVSRLAPVSGSQLKAARPAVKTAHATARPLKLLDPPEPVEVLAEVPDGPPRNIRWRRRVVRIEAAQGPERIAPEWWREHPPDAPGAATDLMRTTRDYWRIEDDRGRRLWIFRRGVYGDPTHPPRWFVHGLMA